MRSIVLAMALLAATPAAALEDIANLGPVSYTHLTLPTNREV